MLLLRGVLGLPAAAHDAAAQLLSSPAHMACRGAWQVRVEDGVMCDRFVVEEDFVHLSHAHGVHLHGDRLAILALRTQQHHLLQVPPPPSLPAPPPRPRSSLSTDVTSSCGMPQGTMSAKPWAVQAATLRAKPW